MSYIRMGYARKYAVGKTEEYVYRADDGIRFSGKGTVAPEDFAEIVLRELALAGVSKECLEEAEEKVVDHLIPEERQHVKKGTEYRLAILQSGEDLSEKGRKLMEQLEDD